MRSLLTRRVFRRIAAPGGSRLSRRTGLRHGLSGGCGTILEGYRSVGSAAEEAEALHDILPATLHGMAHLKQEAVDFAGGLQFVHPLFAQQRAQHTVVTPQKLRKEHALTRRLDDEGSELGYDQPLVRLQITFDCPIQHLSNTLKIAASKLPFFEEKTKSPPFFQNNRIKRVLSGKYSLTLHPEICRNPGELLSPLPTDVAKTDCFKTIKRVMKDKYIDLIEQTFDFPQDEFSVEDNELHFHDIPLMELIKQYGTPLKITYLPKISQQINRAKRMFNVAMAKVDYKGSYNYCYCTKSSHFSFVLEEAMKNDIHLETSSAYDIHIINALYDGGIIDKDRYIICNGFKRPQYVENIAQLVNAGFENTIPVLDNKEELDLFEDAFTKKCKVGIRIACEEEPKFEFYTSRLGIRYNDIVEFYKTKLKNSKKFQLKMLHFFINTGIKDTAYYWNELLKCMNVYCELKAICPELDSLNIGGGFPIKNSLNFEYDYEYLTEEIIAQIKNFCQRNGIEEPNIFTEFGSFTVGESGAALYSIVNQKQQNDRENWYMIDSSFITTLPDTWGIDQRYIMLAINNWDKEYQRVLLGGLTCDSEDFYNSECHTNAIFLPKLEKGNTQYIGFFHTGAYQESLGGFGGIQHCLIPAPKHIIIDRDKSDNEYYTRLFAKEQSYRSMLRILGY